MTTKSILPAVGVLIVLTVMAFAPATSHAAASDVMAPQIPLVNYDYRNYTEIRAALLNLEAQHPDICELVDIGDSWEKIQGISMRDILALKISDNVLLEEDEPEVLIVGLHHAREWTTSEIVYELAENLTSGYGFDPRISWLVDNREIWLVPIVNPDGLDYALTTDEWWRKNRRLNYDHSYGVDLNRNYEGSMNGDPDGEWGGAGSSHDPTSEVYCGLLPFSEPETQAVKALVEAHNFSIAIDFHSYSELVLWPWGYTTDTPPDNEHLVRIGHEMAALNGYLPEQSVGLYPTTGDSIDWFYGGFGIFAFCIEVGLEFHPAQANVVQGIIDENLPVSLLGIEIAGDKYEREFTIGHSPTPTREYSPTGFDIGATITAQRGVNQSSVVVGHRTDGGPFAELPMSVAGSNDSYAATIPAAGVGSVVEYYIRAEDLGRVPKSSPQYAPYELHSFTVVPPPSDLPPSIAHSSRNASATNDTAFVADGIEIYASAIDDVGLSSVRLYCRPEGSSGTFTGSDMSPMGGPGYSAVIPPEYDSGAEYYIEAIDSVGQSARSPADAPSALHLSYNSPPAIGNVLLPGATPGVVSINGSYPVLADVSDDYGVSAVTLHYEGSTVGAGSVAMERATGTNLSGSWVADIFSGTVPGVIFLNITADDLRANSWANGSVVASIDTLPPEFVYEHSDTISQDDPVISVRVHDDVMVEQVLLYFAFGEGAPFAVVEMALVSGDGYDGTYEASLPTSGFLGEVVFYFEASDGSQTSLLPSGAPSSSFTSVIVDGTPLVVEFTAPSTIDGTEGAVLIAYTENLDPGTTLTIVLDGGSGATNTTMAEHVAGVFVCSIAPGLPLGIYTVRLVAEKAQEMLWTSEETSLEVVDATAPTCELLPIDLGHANESRGVILRVNASDMYGVDLVMAVYRIGSQEERSEALALVNGSATNGTWQATIEVGGAEIVYFRVTVYDEAHATFIPSETAWESGGTTPVEVPSEPESFWWPGVATLVAVFLAVSAVVLYLSRARRS